MKKLILLTTTLLLVFSFSQSSYADTYFGTHEIIDITDQGITLSGIEAPIDKDSSGYKVGDMVRYDAVRDILRKSPWQPAVQGV